ncbi:beta-ketoacyl-ACP synthase II [Terasakiispira papahanaumokuakeensis]|uniref:Beta-ketoacyl-ACP synthase II n=1 Tax=Terasakiispira papahanaumokuakeensis TaxID=197479 RepID=A0A1E2VBZ1_9GAMM|nr:beta-ketoacyl-ACP synthase [Terasakiispira papahanaumokuakeensis]ODC04474.1 beta-ketoacyl-ACP synthase II [Terasakiispira papahanaumokuakeensis]
MVHRVVITGMGGISALGDQWSKIEQGLRARQNKIQVMDEWARYENLGTRLGGPVSDFKAPPYPRKKVRGMGRVSLMATRAAEMALEQAGLRDDPSIQDGRMGVAFGSSTGSTEPVRVFGNMLNDGTMQGVTATTYIQMMAHTTAVNIGVFFGLKGRVHTTSSACTSGSQGIGYAYEAIRHGYQQMMIAGGAEELCATEAAVFDTLFATSTQNDTPEMTPRPFDAQRDGLVIGEGAGALVLESLEHAQARGAKILAEIVGFGTNSDGLHVTQPNAQTMQKAMTLALDQAGLAPEAIGYINAHGTATERGDIAESHATRAVFGGQTPISTQKGYLGHTLGACGALEAWFSVEMMHLGWFAPNINLSDLDPQCAELDYIVGDGRHIDTEYVMTNNFAFGGINTSLILRRV